MNEKMAKGTRGKKRGYFVNYGRDEYGWGVVAHSINEAKVLFWKFSGDHEWEEYINIRARIKKDAKISNLPIGVIEDNITGLKAGLYGFFEGCCPTCEDDDTYVIEKDGVVGCYLCIGKHCTYFDKETNECKNPERTKERSEFQSNECDPEECKFWKKDDIEVLDKINNLSWKIAQDQSVIIDPNKNPIVLDDYRRKEMYISGIIFHHDGSSEVLSKRRK